MHLASSILVTALALLVKVNVTEALLLVFAMAFVWITEMINTAIEKAMDFITLEKHSQIKLIKDLAAGAVLVASITALITGSIIFVPKLILL